MDTDGAENERTRKYKGVFPTGEDESTNPENMNAIYAFVRSWGTKEEDDIPLPTWKVVDE